MDTLRAIGLMVAAMASFALSDLFIKYAAVTLSGAEIMLFMGLLGFAIFTVLTRRAGLAVLSPVFFHRMVVIRNVAEMFGTVCIISALVLAPLSLVTAITQSMPLVVTAGAALFLGETVGPRRWGAVVVGLFGVLLILRPGLVEPSLGALLAVGATLGLGARDVVTRLVPKDIANLQLATYAFAVLIPSGGIMVVLTGGFGTPAASDLGWLVAATLSVAVAYYAITAAMRIGDVSLVTPFRYSRLIFALFLAMVFLGERPDALTLAGGAIVIASGLYVLLRARYLARRGLS